MTEGVFWNEFVNQSWVGCFVVKPCSRLVHHTILQRVRHCCHHYDHYQHQNHHWWSWSSWTLTRRQHPVICLPSVKTGWRDKISTPEPLCWWRRRWWDNDDDGTDNDDHIRMLMMVGFYLLITDKNLTTVGVCLDQVYMYQLSFVGLNALVVFECFYLYHALLLKHQIIPDTAVDRHIHQPYFILKSKQRWRWWWPIHHQCHCFKSKLTTAFYDYFPAKVS